MTTGRAGGRGRVLPRAFYDRDALELAPDLLNKLLVRTGDGPRLAARIVEVEAYRGADDPGSHSFRRRTPRNATMFGPPGHLYVYFSYGNHWCMNVVGGPGTQPHAVLLRAAAPLAGVDTMRERRAAARRDRDLCSGPGRLGQAFGVDRSHDGLDLVRGEIRLADDGVAPPTRPGVSVRIGLAAGKGETDLYRFYVEGDENVSAKPR
ncbi:MAG: DNA-3-methyladenine glycosylase [Actinomycetota bacterium]|nr:DNA-3-methyladenine glycosylase [Actinomycetota bacterium]